MTAAAVSSNEIVTINLITIDADEENPESYFNKDSMKIFKPIYTYPFLGDEELIIAPAELNFNMNEMRINIFIDSVSFNYLIEVEFPVKESSDVLKTFENDLKSKFQAKVPYDGFFCIHRKDFIIKSREFYRCNLSTILSNENLLKLTFPSFVNLFKISEMSRLDSKFLLRLQFILLFFIEGASAIDVNDDNWSILLIQSSQDKSIIGFITFYSFFAWPDKQRIRVSQVLILPPYQGKGYASLLYESMLDSFELLSHDKTCDSLAELTVEDCNDEFQAVRNYVDYKRFLKVLMNSSEKNFNHPTNTIELTTFIKNSLKITWKQARTLMEMYLYQQILFPSQASSQILPNELLHFPLNEKSDLPFKKRKSAGTSALKLLIKKRLLFEEFEDINMFRASIAAASSPLDSKKNIVEKLNSAATESIKRYGEIIEKTIIKLNKETKNK